MQTIQQVFSYAEKDRIVDINILKNLNREELESLIISVLNKQGKTKHIEIKSSAVEDRNQQLTNIIEHAVDARKAEKRLQESEEKYHNLFYNHAAVKLIIDAKTGAVYYSNSIAIEFYCWSSTENTCTRKQTAAYLKESAKELENFNQLMWAEEPYTIEMKEELNALYEIADTRVLY